MQVSSSAGVSGQEHNLLNVQKAEEKDDDRNEISGGEEAGGAESAFTEFMRAALGTGKAEVNEEELFAALVEQRLNKESPEAAELFREKKSELMVSMARADGYVSVEDVTVQALKATVEAGKLEMDAAERINGEAFSAAQLDDNLEALYDGRGDANDPTKAVGAMEAALSKMQLEIEAFEAGTKTAASRSLDAPINQMPGGAHGGPDGASGSGGPAPSGESSAADGSGGFLWKPKSESDGKLVVLLPTSLNGLIDRVEIHSKLPPDESSKIDTGRYTGIHNGDRTHFRFSKPGADYGSDVNVVVFKDDGSTVTYNIDDGSKRID